MKLQKEKIICGQQIKHYHFPTAHSLQSPGLILCYFCMKQSSNSSLSLHLEIPDSFHAKDPLTDICSTEQFRERFSSLESFLLKFDRKDFAFWEITFLYHQISCQITGRRTEPVLSFAFPAKYPVPVVSFLTPIEQEIQRVLEEQSKLLHIVMDRFQLKESVASSRLKKLADQPDLFWEFISRISGTDVKTEISVYGYTAKQLEREQPLSMLGAYLYLVDLRKCPGWAQKQLQTGLKRK